MLRKIKSDLEGTDIQKFLGRENFIIFNVYWSVHHLDS